ncbi:MAG: hypothetical protein ACR2QV_16720 [Gammaproteobacteria bacterium]
MRIFIFATILCFGFMTASAAEPGDAYHPHQHASLFLGAGAERKKDGREKQIGIAVGGEYEYWFRPQWAIGGVFEALGKNTLRDIVVVVPISYRPAEGWRLFAGPGYEFTATKDKALLRIGVGYEIKLDGNWSVAPELIADFIDGGAQTLLMGVAIGYEF